MWPQGFPSGDYARQVRHRLQLSQRELAAAVGVTQSALARIESGRTRPSVDVVERLLESAGFVLTVVEEVDGALRFVPPLLEWEDCRDGAGRRYPAHLPLVLDPLEG